MNTEGYIKSNIACLIVSLMFQEEGYVIIPMRNNDALDRLTQCGVNKTKFSNLLFNLPNFLLIDKKKNAIPITVKFKGAGKPGRNIEWGLKQIEEYCPGTSIIVVTNSEPFFYFADGKQIQKLSESVLKVNKKTSDDFARLVLKFLG